MTESEYRENFEEALQFMAKGQVFDAELKLQILHSEYSEDFKVLSKLGLIKLYKAEYDDALILLGEALRVRPDAVEIAGMISLSMAKLKRLDEAAEFLAYSKEHEQIGMWANRAEAAIMIEHGLFDRALQILLIFTTENSELSWDVLNDLGRCYYELGEFCHAEEAFTNAIENAQLIGLQIPFLYYNIALCQLEAGMRDEAKDSISQALELDSELAIAWSTLGVMVAEDEDIERGLDYLERALRIEPEEPTHWYMIARIHKLNGDSETAEQHMLEGYRALQALQPDKEIPDGLKDG